MIRILVEGSETVDTLSRNECPSEFRFLRYFGWRPTFHSLTPLHSFTSPPMAAILHSDSSAAVFSIPVRFFSGVVEKEKVANSFSPSSRLPSSSAAEALRSNAGWYNCSDVRCRLSVREHGTAYHYYGRCGRKFYERIVRFAPAFSVSRTSLV